MIIICHDIFPARGLVHIVKLVYEHNHFLKVGWVNSKFPIIPQGYMPQNNLTYKGGAIFNFTGS